MPEQYRAKDVVRTTVVRLEGREIPRNEGGDPAFQRMEQVFEVFTAEEIVALVNRQLYQMEYQREVHRKRSQQERDQLKPIKELYRELYGKPFTKATEKELDTVMEEMKRRQGNG